jgi:hypothetical protein
MVQFWFEWQVNQSHDVCLFGLVSFSLLWFVYVFLLDATKQRSSHCHANIYTHPTTWLTCTIQGFSTSISTMHLQLTKNVMLLYGYLPKIV